jgi:hypothetical protein
MTQTASVRTPAQLFAELPARRYPSYREFENALVALFNAHALEFPTGYGWRDALQWGLRQGLVAREGDRIVVRQHEV